MATYKRPPAGPAGPIGEQNTQVFKPHKRERLARPKSRREMIAEWYAAHDRPAPQPTYTSGVPRRHALTKVPTVTLDSRKKRRVS